MLLAVDGASEYCETAEGSIGPVSYLDNFAARKEQDRMKFSLVIVVATLTVSFTVAASPADLQKQKTRPLFSNRAAIHCHITVKTGCSIVAFAAVGHPCTCDFGTGNVPGTVQLGRAPLGLGQEGIGNPASGG